MWSFLRRTSQSWTYEEMEPQFVPPDRQEHFTTSVPSVLAGASFTITVTVGWRGGAAEDSATVRDVVRDHLARKAADYSVTAMEQLADLLNSRGRTARPVPGTDLVITYLHAHVTTSAEALAAAASWEELQRQSALEGLRRQQEIHQLRWLRDEIFGQPDMARMYWHVKHPNDLSSLSADLFDDIAARLNDGSKTTSRQGGESPIGMLIAEFVKGLDADERRHLINQLGRVFRSFDRADLADRLEAGGALAEHASP
jgi:hypothetical protein